LRESIALLCALAVLAPPLQARNSKGDKFYKLGQKAEAANNFDAALNYYDQAVDANPDEPQYLIADERMRSKAAQAHLEEGRRLRGEQKLDEALAQFQKAFLANPSSPVMLQEIRQTTEMIKERAKVPSGTPILTPAERARQEVEQRITSLDGPPSLKPLNTIITHLAMNNQPSRVLYESVGKLAGINVLFDPQGIDAGAGKNFNLDLNNVTLEEALDYIALETHTFWKPISRNAIFVTQETDPKRQEYQDELVKVFYIQNASTQNELTEIFNGVRTGAKLTTGIFSVFSQNAIVVRGSPDTIALAEKLIHDLDRPKAEVLIDVVVMEVNKTVINNIGAALLGQGGLSVPLNFTPRPGLSTPTSSSSSTSGSGSTGTGSTGTGSTGTGSTGGGGTSTTPSSITVNNLRRLSTADYSVTLPSTIVQALLSDTRNHVMQRPELRATDGGKASLKIGQKIPYVSGSLNSAVATPGSIPYATTQFQQVDVGTNIDMQPHVNGAEDVSMHVKVEISNVLNTVNIAGIDEPVIGQQVDEADIRMKDGEVSILGGLSDKELANVLSGVPGFTNIPLLGYIFGNKKNTTTDNQILLALIPHILRAPDISRMADTGVLAGTERVTRVEYKPQGTPVTPPGNTSVPQGSVPPSVPPQPLTPVPGKAPQTPPTTPAPGNVSPPKPPDGSNQPGAATQAAPAVTSPAQVPGTATVPNKP
jgi:general secretion pathway protein D